jgi:hypothetical protein
MPHPATAPDAPTQKLGVIRALNGHADHATGAAHALTQPAVHHASPGTARVAVSDCAAKAQEEIALVELMISIWCHGHNHIEGRVGDGQLCPECQELMDYARERIHRCPRLCEKTFCSTCPVHCYRPAMRERIREVMRYSGPRMLKYRPIPALKHALNTLQAKFAAR